MNKVREERLAEVVVALGDKMGPASKKEQQRDVAALGLKTVGAPGGRAAADQQRSRAAATQKPNPAGGRAGGRLASWRFFLAFVLAGSCACLRRSYALPAAHVWPWDGLGWAGQEERSSAARRHAGAAGLNMVGLGCWRPLCSEVPWHSERAA